MLNSVRGISMELTAEKAREALDYNPETGGFSWRNNSGRAVFKGAPAGSESSHGYIRIGLYRVTYYAHRLAWLIHYSAWPEHQIDHIDCNRRNNSIKNLRECSNAQNQLNQPVRKNNNSGVKGVSWNSAARKWHVQARAGGKIHQGGFYASLEEAGAAAIALRERLHGEFARD